MYNLHTGTKAARLIAPKRSDTVTKPSNWSLHMPCYSMSWKIFNSKIFEIFLYLKLFNIFKLLVTTHALLLNELVILLFISNFEILCKCKWVYWFKKTEHKQRICHILQFDHNNGKCQKHFL